MSFASLPSKPTNKMKSTNLKSISTSLFAILALASTGLAQIEAGKSIQIFIMGVPAEEKGKIDALYPVSEGGTVNLPFIGKIQASGMSDEGLASAIQNAYRSAQIYNNPTIQVISTGKGSSVDQEVVHLGGQVRGTGAKPFQKNLTIYQAVQAAGGATEFGSLKRVKLIRNGKSRVFDLTQDQFKNVPLEPNDTIEVPQKNMFGQ
jgi:protein involved in polysaccharide export with SLBB domain